MKGEAKRLKFALEDYISFFEKPDVKRYSMFQIHEILFINGFIKYKTKGKVIQNLDTLEMIDPRRSTLRARAVFPFALLTVEEVKDDVRSIGWEDCPIGSILAVGSAVEKEEEAAGESTNLSLPISSMTASSTAAAAAPAPLQSKKRKKRRVRKESLALIAA